MAVKGSPGGGRRVGAGRKPKRPVLAFEASGAAVAMPADLTAAQAAAWQRWAGLAQQAGTLTAQTVPAFRLLCETHADLVAWRQQIEEDGPTFVKVTVDGSGQEQRELKAHPLIAKVQAAAYRVEMQLARFSLAPNGRPVEVAQPKADDAKWAGLIG